MENVSSSDEDSGEIDLDFETLRHMNSKQLAKFVDVNMSDKVGDIIAGEGITGKDFLRMPLAQLELLLANIPGIFKARMKLEALHDRMTTKPETPPKAGSRRTSSSSSRLSYSPGALSLMSPSSEGRCASAASSRRSSSEIAGRSRKQSTERNTTDRVQAMLDANKIVIPAMNIKLFSNSDFQDRTHATFIHKKSLNELVRLTISSVRDELLRADIKVQREPSIEVLEEISEILVEVYPKIVDCYIPTPDPPHEGLLHQLHKRNGNVLAAIKDEKRKRLKENWGYYEKEGDERTKMKEDIDREVEKMYKKLIVTGKGKTNYKVKEDEERVKDRKEAKEKKRSEEREKEVRRKYVGKHKKDDRQKRAANDEVHDGSDSEVIHSSQNIIKRPRVHQSSTIETILLNIKDRSPPKGRTAPKKSTSKVVPASKEQETSKSDESEVIALDSSGGEQVTSTEEQVELVQESDKQPLVEDKQPPVEDKQPLVEDKQPLVEENKDQEGTDKEESENEEKETSVHEEEEEQYILFNADDKHALKLHLLDLQNDDSKKGKDEKESILSDLRARSLEAYKATDQNWDYIEQCYEIEFPERRLYVEKISSGNMVEKAKKVMARYPIFKHFEQLILEMGRCIHGEDAVPENYEDLIATSMMDVIKRVHKYGVQEKKIGTACTTEGKMVKHVLSNLDEIFPMAINKEKDTNVYITADKRSTEESIVQKAKYPTLIVLGARAYFAFGKMQIGSMERPGSPLDWAVAVCGLFALYYTFNVPYPKGLQAGMLLIQCLVLQNREKIDEDDIRASDMMTHYDAYHAWLADNDSEEEGGSSSKD